MSPAAKGAILGALVALCGAVWAWRQRHPAPLPCEVLGDASGRLWVEQKHPTFRVYADSLPDLATARRIEEQCNAESGT